MSGGYYNYVGWKELEDLILYSYQDELLRVAHRLLGISYSQDAAKTTIDILEDIEQFQRSMESRLNQIRSVWQALEYFDSHDRGEDRLVAALDKWRAITRTEPFVGEGI